MERILKYELSIKENQVLDLPLNSEILRVDDVDGKFYLWAIVNAPKNVIPKPVIKTEPRYIEFYKTGQEFKSPRENLKYLGFCKLFIMQELGLYVFENISK